MASSSSALCAGDAPVKMPRPRGRMAVNPLKKLHPDRESLDLDRDWDEQPSLSHYQQQPQSPYDAYDGHHYTYYAGAGSARSPRDLGYSFPSSDFGGAVVVVTASAPSASGGEPPSAARAHKFSHGRSASAASHASIATTNSAGARNGGSFVHPFQQTPQTSLSYAHSRASLDIARDCSPTITEDDDDYDPYASFHSASSSIARHVLYQQPAHQPQHQRRSSAASQLPAALPDTNPPLPVGTASRSHLASASQSWSELPLSARASLVDLPLSIAASPISPHRSSLDVAGFRLRSRSEVDIVSHQEHVRETRRKFDAKQRAKEERYARQQGRKQGRADSRDFQRLEHQESRFSKTGRASLPSRVGSDSTGPRTAAGGIDGAETDEKPVSSSHNHRHAFFHPHLSRAKADDGPLGSHARSKTSRQKTSGVWIAFILWLRTRLLKLGRR